MNVDFFNDLIELQSKINEILNVDFDSEAFESYLSEHHQYLEDKRSAIQLLSTLDKFISNHPQHSDYHKQLIISSLLENTLKLFSSYELYKIFTSYSLRLLLYKNGFINIDTITERSSVDPYDFVYFINEIKEENKQFYQYAISKEKNRKMLKEINQEKHNELRMKGRNHHQIAEIIRNDDIEQFQEIISQNNISLNSRIPYSFYEDCQIISAKSDMPFLIDYASFFSSIKIFKFLWINDIKGNLATFNYAIAGGNYEIIHLLESVHKNIINKDSQNYAILFHRNDIYSYLQDTYEIEFSLNHFFSSIDSYNTEMFILLLPQAIERIKLSEFQILFLNEKSLFFYLFVYISTLLFELAIWGRIDYLSYFKNLDGFDISTADDIFKKIFFIHNIF